MLCLDLSTLSEAMIQMLSYDLHKAPGRDYGKVETALKWCGTELGAPARISLAH